MSPRSIQAGDSGWILTSERTPAPGQRCYWSPLSGAVFFGLYEDGRFFAPRLCYVASVVTKWKPAGTRP